MIKLKPQISILILILFIAYGCPKDDENLPPTLKITSPITGEVFIQGDIVTISVDAEDPDGSIKEVRFYIDDVGKYSLSNFPYNYDWDTKGVEIDGIHKIKVIVTDDGNLETENSLDVTIDVNEGEFTDTRDTKKYNWIKIGTQKWITDNLAYLPSVSPPTSLSITEPYYFVYGFYGTDVSAAKAMENYKIYGVLYNWPAAKAACPSGWHLPSDSEWSTLITYLGGKSIAGGKMKEVGNTHWLSPNEGATNVSGFSSLPGGYNSNLDFYSIGKYGFYWSSIESSTLTYKASSLYLDNGNSNVMLNINTDKNIGYSVRCIRD